MVIVKWSDKVEASGDNIYAPLCVGLYKEQDDCLVPWSGTDPDAKLNCFTWSKEENDWIIPEDHYNKAFKNWQGPIHNGKFRLHTLKEKRNTEETYTKYACSINFNGIPREVNPEIPINSYKDQFCEHMIRNGMWDVFYPPDPCNKDKKWDIIIYQSRTPLDYMKRHGDSLQKGSEADQYVVQNLKWSGLYLMSTLSNTLLQKVLTFVLLTATGPEVFFVTMTKFLYDLYDALEYTLTHML